MTVFFLLSETCFNRFRNIIGCNYIYGLWSKQVNTSVVDNIMWFISPHKWVGVRQKGKQGKQVHGMNTERGMYEFLVHKSSRDWWYSNLKDDQERNDQKMAHPLELHQTCGLWSDNLLLGAGFRSHDHFVRVIFLKKWYDLSPGKFIHAQLNVTKNRSFNVNVICKIKL